MKNPFQTKDLQIEGDDYINRSMGIEDSRADELLEHMSQVTKKSLFEKSTWTSNLYEVTSVCKSIDETAFCIFLFARAKTKMEHKAEKMMAKLLEIKDLDL